MIPDHAQTLYSRFEQEGIPLLLAVGWAVNHHGYSRITCDVDWICSRKNETKASSLMSELGFTKVAEGMASRFLRKVINITHPSICFGWMKQALRKWLKPRIELAEIAVSL